MKVLIAVDSFKGSLSSLKAGKAITQGINNVLPEVTTTVIPMADGGEGTVEAMVSALSGKKVKAKVTSPIGDQIEGEFGVLPDGTAVIEMAAASGLTLVPENKRNPLYTTTFGTGELIKSALDHGSKNILIGIGGSATNDAGVGMAQALGALFLDEQGNDISWGGGNLGKITKIDLSGIDPRLKRTSITVMCDVDNPLCGARGASAIYGPQKGADLEMVQELDKNLEHLADLIKEQLGKDVKEKAGAGAAGGLGAGLMAFCNAQLKTGVEAVLDTVGFDNMLTDASLVITGEGRIDAQSLYGKVPMGVARRTKNADKPVIAIVGSIGEGAEDLYQYGLNSIVSIVNSPMTLDYALENAYELTVACAERVIRILLAGNKIIMD